MTEYKRLYVLISIMTSVSLLVGGITIFMLYQAAIDEERDRLMESAQSQARLIEAVARFDAVQSQDFPQGSTAATISQIVDAHKNFKGVGDTGEFALGRREGEQIVFLLSHRHQDLEDVRPVPWDSHLAQPMRLALSGFSGTVIAVDYRGERVLAAHEPVAELELGIVAKIDMAEVRAPFIQAGLVAFASALLIVFIASLLFLRISNPMIKQIQEQHAKLDAILETAVEGIITFDQQGRIDSFNRAAEQLFGYAEQEVLGQPVTMIMGSSGQDVNRDFLSEHLQPVSSKTVADRHEAVGLRKDGSEFSMDLSVSEVHVGGLRFFTGIVRDNTDRKNAEQNSRLAAMGHMLSTVAHESRNSLQRVQAGVDMLRLDVEDNLELVEQLDRIERAGEDLTTLFKELREYAAPITLERKSCDLREAWRIAWSHLVRQRADRQIELREETNGLDLKCPIDEFRIEQVFRNLMENSFAACSDPTTIEIACHDVLHQGAPAVCVAYRDNGPGLTDEQVKRVFEAFFTTKPKGTGLGMAIAERILKAHDGTIAVGSRNHGGAEFLITFPRKEAQAI